MAVFKRELRAIFLSPLAGTVGAMFLLLAGVMNAFNLNEYMRMNVTMAARYRMMNLDPQFLDLNEVLLRQDLAGLAFLALIFLPLIAMGLLADERRSGTLELLMTSPLSESALVLAKFCAAQLYFLILLAVSLIGIGILAFYGPVHWPTLLLGGLGIALMGGAFLAVAIWLGSMTRSSLIAASAGFALMLMLWLVDGFARPGAVGFPGGFLRAASALGHIEPMLRGLLDLVDVLYFLVLTVVGLDLAMRSLRLMRGGKARGKFLGMAMQSMLRGAVILLIGGMLIFVSGRQAVRWDLSREQSNSLSPQTLSILDSVAEAGVSVTLFFPDREPERGRIASLLGAFAAGRGNFSWEIVDPGQHPRRAIAAGASESGTVLLAQGDRREQFVVDADERGVFNLDEQRLAQALLALGRDAKARLRIVQGPGILSLADPAGLSTMQRLLEFDGYDVQAWDYLAKAQDGVPEDTDVLVLPGPHRRMPDVFLVALGDYMASGGAFLLLLDPSGEMADSSFAAGLDEILAGRGLTAGAGFVVDLGEENINVGKGFEVPVVSRYGPHPVTKSFARMAALTCFPLSRALTGVEGFTPAPHPLAFSTEKSFIETGGFGPNVHFDPEEDPAGPHVLAAASDSSASGGGPMLVVGDSHFVSSAHIDWNANADFLLNAIAWLDDEVQRIAPRPPRHTTSILKMDRGQRRLYLSLNALILPLCVILLWPMRLLLGRRRSAGNGVKS